MCYIVRQTVGKLVEGKIPKQVAKLRVLDPACGSGSFLINAYQFLLDWHHNWYLAYKPESWAKGRNPVLVQTTSGWKLTVAERKRILLDNIYGVDIDPQAVEVTKLSLLLKVLEGESEQTIQPFLRLFQQRALPDLGDNIKCGNSLIGSEAFQWAQLSLLPDSDQYRINIFDWSQGFPEIMQAGGFDAIIGNPPYIRIQTMKEWAPTEVELYKRLYRSASSGNYDIYVVFVEKALSLLNKAGRMGFILPHKFFNSQYGESLREIISKGRHLSHVVHFGDQQVFTGATTYTCLLFLDKAGVSECSFVKADNLNMWRTENKGNEGKISAKNISAVDWNFLVGAEAKIFERLNKWPIKLSNIADRIAQGIRTSANEVYVLDLVSEGKNVITAHSTILARNVKLERKSVSLFLQGREIKRYHVIPSGKVVIIPYTIQEERKTLIPETEIRKSFPLLYDYLIENKEYLINRERGRMHGPNWYAYIYPKNIDVMQNPKILVPDIADKASFALDEGGDYVFTSGYGITLRSDIKESTIYILALLNSSLLDFYLKRISTTIRGGFFRYFSKFIEQLPIRRINFSMPADKTLHDNIVNSVGQIISLYKKFPETRTPHDKELLERRIKNAINSIDESVCCLYGINIADIPKNPN